MGKVFIEDKEINITEKREEISNGPHEIDGNQYILRSQESIEFKSSIFSYGKAKVLVSRLNLFNEKYFRFVLFNDQISKAWNILELSAKLEVHIKRLNDDMFFVIGDNKDEPEVLAQISFCKLKPSTKVEEITLNFSKLVDVHFSSKKEILICSEDIDKVTHKTCQTLAIYSHEGKLLKTLYEFDDDDKEKYYYEIKQNNLSIYKKRS